MNIRYPIYEGVYRILTKETGWRRLMTGNVRLGNILTLSASLYCPM